MAYGFGEILLFVTLKVLYWQKHEMKRSIFFMPKSIMNGQKKFGIFGHFYETEELRLMVTC
jgi:hypothetical protein